MPPNFSNLSEYKKASISYISGYVAKMIAKNTICIKCQNALVLSYHFEQTSFLKFKDRGGLVKPTKSVVVICEETERCFQRLLASTNGNLTKFIILWSLSKKLMHKKYFILKIKSAACHAVLLLTF